MLVTTTTTPAAYLTVRHVAELLGCSHDVITKAINRGDLPAVKYGRLTRIHRDDLARFLTKHASGGKRKTA